MIISSKFKVDRKLKAQELTRNVDRALGKLESGLALSLSGLVLDQALVQRAAREAITRYMADIALNQEMAFKLILERGMAEAGINIAKVGIDKYTVQVLWKQSPLWQAYSGMNTELNLAVNEVISKEFMAGATVSPRKIATEIRDIVGNAEWKARRIARTESAVVMNKGRELGFAVADPRGEYRYTWGGPFEKRPIPCKSCRWVIDQIPDGGVRLQELKDIVHEATKRFHPKLIPRDWTVHPHCRHYPQFLRRVS